MKIQNLQKIKQFLFQLFAHTYITPVLLKGHETLHRPATSAFQLFNTEISGTISLISTSEYYTLLEEHRIT